MKKYYRLTRSVLVLAGILFIAGCSQTLVPKTTDQDLPAPKVIVFNEKEHDFGVIKQSGGVRQYDFGFTYVGDEAITVTATPGNCACTTATINKKVFQKGDKGVLTVFFNPNLHAEPEGRFEKIVSILTEPALEPVPEVSIWQEIDLDLGEEFFELSQMASSPPLEKKQAVSKSSSPVPEEAAKVHGPENHEVIGEIGNDAQVSPLDTSTSVRRFTLTAKEVNSELDDGLNYLYWTYDGVVPGPLLRAREGDTIELTLKNLASNHMPHSIDLHAVNGPGGGASDVQPGEEKTFRFKALNPGVYIYHCATQEVAEHMANGAYGLIVIEPKDGFGVVDKEFYVVQSEFYSVMKRGSKGTTQFSGVKMRAEQPEYIVFNGRKGSLTSERALQAKVGDKIRIFIGNGGVAKVSSFHVIGEIFDTVYPEGGTPVQNNIQTTVIPAGGASIVEFSVDVPGTYKLVDHALARLTKGAYAELIVSGNEQPDIFKPL